MSTELLVVEEEDKSKAWEWTEQREQAAELVSQGHSNASIAATCKVHRNTVSNWKATQEFMQRVREIQGTQREHIRRVRENQTIAFTERAGNLLNKTLERVESRIKNNQDPRPGDVDLVTTFSSQFRQFREEERKDFGDNVTRTQAHVLMQGQVDHQHSVKAQPFREFLTDALTKKQITGEVIEASTADEPVVAVIEAALLETDLLEVIMEEDRKAAALAKDGNK